MNILSYSHAYMGGGHNGGAETTLHDVMRLLRLEQHTMTALVSKPHPDGSGNYYMDGVMVQAHSSKRDPEMYFPMNDVIISHLECAARTGLVSKTARKKAVHLLHNDQPYCVTAAVKYADAVIYNTEWIKKAYAGLSYRTPSVVVHPPVDPKRYAVETTREYITLINLTVGTTNRLSYDKGAHTFYELARLNPDLKFLGVKGGYGDQFIPDDLPGNVTIMEHTNNILEVYRRTKLLLVPSKYESYGRVAVEGGCSGIPSLVTDTEGTREALGYSTTLLPFSDVAAWQWALEYTLGTYEHAALSASERATHNWKRSLEEIQDLNKMMLGLAPK